MRCESMISLLQFRAYPFQQRCYLWVIRIQIVSPFDERSGASSPSACNVDARRFSVTKNRGFRAAALRAARALPGTASAGTGSGRDCSML